MIMRNSSRPFIPANEYNEMKFTIIVRWNEWPVRFAHNYTASFRSILRVLSPFSFWEFILTFSHIPPCFHAKPPDFPRLFEPREIDKDIYKSYSACCTIHWSSVNACMLGGFVAPFDTGSIIRLFNNRSFWVDL